MNKYKNIPVIIILMITFFIGTVILNKLTYSNENKIIHDNLRIPRQPKQRTQEQIDEAFINNWIQQFDLERIILKQQLLTIE